MVPALSVSCLTASPSNVNPPHPHRKRKRSIVFATTNPDFATPKSIQYPVPSTQYPVRYDVPKYPAPSTKYEVRSTGRAKRPPEREKPRGASAEAFALSGFPLLPELQSPEGPGLPVKARYRLSVVPALSVSCLTASPSNVNPPHPHRKPKRSIVFATTNPDFATPKSIQYPVPSTQYEVVTNPMSDKGHLSPIYPLRTGTDHFTSRPKLSTSTEY